MKKISEAEFYRKGFSGYDLAVRKSQLANYGCVWLDEYGCPIDDEYLLEELKGDSEPCM